MSFSAGTRYNSGPVVNITTAATTLTAADSGKIFRVNVADAVFTLPAMADGDMEGVFYTFVIDTVSATTGCSLNPGLADNFNGGTDNKDLINTAATDVRGDSVTIVSDNSEGWLTTAMHGIWAEEA